MEWVKAMGADYIVNHYQSIQAQIVDLGIHEVDYVLCLNHFDSHWNEIIESLAPQGKICSIIESEGQIDLNSLKNKSNTFVWEFMFTKSLYETSDMISQHELLDSIADLVDKNLIKTTLSKVLSPINASNLRLAHKEVETGRMIGKIVVANVL